MSAFLPSTLRAFARCSRGVRAKLSAQYLNLDTMG